MEQPIKEIKYKDTSEIKIPKALSEQILGQDQGLKIIKKAALQRRNVLLIGEPGTGKCTGKDTIIPTTLGDFKAEELYSLLSKNTEKMEQEDGTYLKPSERIEAFTLNKTGKIVKNQIIAAYKSKEKKKCLKIISHSGAEIIVSGEHPLLSIEKGAFIFKKSEQLTEGKVIGLARAIPLLNKENIFLESSKNLKVIDQGISYQVKYEGKNGVSSLTLSLPKKINEDLAYFLGLYVAEGDYSDGLSFSNKDKKLKEKITQVAKENFSYPEEFIIDKGESLQFRKGRTLASILESAFNQKVWDYEKKKIMSKQSGKKRIPKLVMQGNKLVIRSFLAGYIDGDGHFDLQGLEVSSASKNLIEDLRLLLLKLGIIARTSKKLKYAANTEKKTKREYFYLTITGNENLLKLKKDLPLLKEYKKKKLEELSIKKGNTNVDLIFEVGALFKELKNNLLINYKKYKTYNQNFNRYARGVQSPSRNYIQSIVKNANDDLYKIKGLRFSLVKYENYAETITQGIRNFYENLEENKKYFSKRSLLKYKQGEVLPSLKTICSVNNLKNKSGEFYQLFKQAEKFVNLNHNITPCFGNQLLTTTIRSIDEFEARVNEFCIKLIKIENILKRLEALSHSDVFLDKIKEISIIEEEVYDFEVKDTHNFITGSGIIIHNSLLGQALAENLSTSKLTDILCLPNEQDENNPLIRVMPKGKGKEFVNKLKLQNATPLKNQNIIFFILVIISIITPWYIRKQYGDILAAASLIGSMIFIAAVAIFLSLNRRMGTNKIKIPKLLIDNSEQKVAPFIDATGSHSGALLGDCLHDPLQTLHKSSNILSIKENKNSRQIQLQELNIKNEVDKCLTNHHYEIIRNEKGYEATFLDKREFFVIGEKENKIREFSVLSVNRYPKEGELIQLTTESGKQLIVTPEHKVAIKSLLNKIKYIRADQIKSWHKVITLV